MQLKRWRSICALALLLAVLGGCTPQAGMPGSGTDPVTITLWNYYNGAQQKVFNQMVQDFNSTVGANQGILVESHSFGAVGELIDKVLDAVHGRVGAEEMPDVFAAYADTAYEIDRLGKVAELGQYLTEKERQAYIAAYLEEGCFAEGAGFKIFPIAKSTEVLTLNRTDWTAFAAATGARGSDLTTWEGIASLAEQYYRWTDSLTPDIPEDGKAFFGRDAFANYLLVGSRQLGCELFTVKDGKAAVTVDEAVMRRLWDNYYVPYINGYFGAYGKFRSDDLRTGDLVACVGASSGAPFFAGQVTKADGSTYPIALAVYPLPNFAGTSPMAVQQGAGMVVAKSTPQREKAAVTFLKWFTEPEQNNRFALASGYLPVTYAAGENLSFGQGLSPVLRETLSVGHGMTKQYQLYTTKPFPGGGDARKIVADSMKRRAEEDRLAVLDLMKYGTPRAEAVARFDNDAHFGAWLTSFRAALEKAVVAP